MKILVFDTETIDIKDLDMFDFGYVLIEDGKIIDKGSYLIEEVYGTELFKRAYYYEKNKIRYEEKLANGQIEIKSMEEVRELFNIAAKKADIIAGFVIDFDIRVLNYNYKKYLGKEKVISIAELSNKFTVIDISLLFALIYSDKKEYKEFCIANGYMTDKGNYKTTAEVMYRFITENLEHEEEHTAFSDSIEEFEIMDYLISKFGTALLTEAANLTMKGQKAWRLLK